MLKNSIYAQMWKENPKFRKDMKTAFGIFAFAVLLFIYGSVKGCCIERKAEKAQQESVRGKENKDIDAKLMFNAQQLFKKSNFGLQR